MTSYQRAEMLAALSHTTEMVTGLLEMLDRIVDSNQKGERRTATADVRR